MLIGASLLLAGCNPYNSEFACKGAPFGSCSPTPEVYKDIIEGRETKGSPIKDESKPAEGEDKDKSLAANKEKGEGPISAYREAELRKVTKLLKQPVTPVVVPPKVIRILFMPFETEDGMLNMPEYSYVMMDRPKWVMGDYLLPRGDR